jgi:predicted neutral ceramidase superfamily lipid hydrolase
VSELVESPSNRENAFVLDYARAAGLDVGLIAARHRAVRICLIAYLTSFVLLEMLRGRPLQGLVGLAFVSIVITSCIRVILLMSALNCPRLAIVLGVLALMPGIGVTTVVVADRAAAKTLRANRMKVGFFGVRRGKKVGLRGPIAAGPDASPEAE